jgi:hypothetical protein
MQKQAAQICSCGNVMAFPEGQIKAKCQSCETIWELGPEGYWTIKNINHARLRFHEACKKVVNFFVESLKPAFDALRKWALGLWDKLLEIVAKRICPKWLHYYKHSKKQRIRKKYRRIIQTHLMEILITLSNDTALRTIERWQVS